MLGTWNGGGVGELWGVWSKAPEHCGALPCAPPAVCSQHHFAPLGSPLIQAIPHCELRGSGSPFCGNTAALAAARAMATPVITGTLRFGPGKAVVKADFAELSRKFLASDVQQFAALSGDHNPVHLDEGFAATTKFRRCIVHGMLYSSLFSTIFATRVPGVIYVAQSLKFTAPVFVGDAVTARFVALIPAACLLQALMMMMMMHLPCCSVEVIDVKQRFVTCKTTVTNASNNGTVVVDGEATVMLPKLDE